MLILLILIFCFVFAIFVMLFAFMLNESNKEKKKAEMEQKIYEKFCDSINIKIESNNYSVDTTYTYKGMERSPVVVFSRNIEGDERVFLASELQKQYRLNAYGSEQIKLLGVAIEHQKGKLLNKKA